jgi:[protein-PII] uridylyltransferase
VVEVNGTDRPGLLHRLTVRLAHQNLQISAAKISTYGASIVDVFYVKDLFGLKVNSDRKLDGLKNAMLAELEPQVKTAKKAVARAAE